MNESITELPTEEALRALLRNKAAADLAYRECLIRHGIMVRWINDEIRKSSD